MTLITTYSTSFQLLINSVPRLSLSIALSLVDLKGCRPCSTYHLERILGADLDSCTLDRYEFLGVDDVLINKLLSYGYKHDSKDIHVTLVFCWWTRVNYVFITLESFFLESIVLSLHLSQRLSTEDLQRLILRPQSRHLVSTFPQRLLSAITNTTLLATD